MVVEVSECVRVGGTRFAFVSAGRNFDSLVRENSHEPIGESLRAGRLTGLAVAGLDASAARAQMMPVITPTSGPPPGFAAPGFGAPAVGMQPQVSPFNNPLFAARSATWLAAPPPRRTAVRPTAAATRLPRLLPALRHQHGVRRGACTGGRGHERQGQLQGGPAEGPAAGRAGPLRPARQQEAGVRRIPVRATQHPTLESIRQDAIKQQAVAQPQRADPTEIASATALNNILGALGNHAARQGSTPP